MSAATTFSARRLTTSPQAADSMLAMAVLSSLHHRESSDDDENQPALRHLSDPDVTITKPLSLMATLFHQILKPGTRGIPSGLGVEPA